MILHHTPDILTLRPRDVGRAALAFGAAALLRPTRGAAQGLLERLKEDIKGDIKDLKEDVREEVAYFYGMEGYAYGFPLVIMDLTKAVMTAASTAGEYSAPLNQLTRMHTDVHPDFEHVVRISRNGLRVRV